MVDNENHQLQNGVATPTTDGDQWWNLFTDDRADPDTEALDLAKDRNTIRKRVTSRCRTVALAARILAVLVLISVALWSTVSFFGTDPPQGDTTRMSEQDIPDAASSGLSEEQLMSALPSGYRRDACATATNSGAARLQCGRAVDGRGPRSASFTLFANRQRLDIAFSYVVRKLDVVDCPGGIQSPGPWRRSITPEHNYGLVVCGFGDGTPVVAWTDDAQLVLSEVYAGATGPDIAELFRWWSGQS